MRRHLLAIACVAFALGACGVKGPLEPPPDAEPDKVREPWARPAPPRDGAAPSEPFVLDGLLL